ALLHHVRGWRRVGVTRPTIGDLGAAARGGVVIHRPLQVGDHRVEALLDGTEIGALGVDFVDRAVDGLDGRADGGRRGGQTDTRRDGRGQCGATGTHVNADHVDDVVGGDVGAELEGLRGGRGQDGGSVEGRALDDAVDIPWQRVEYRVQGRRVAAVLRGVTGLHVQFTHALQPVAVLA